MSTQKIKKLMVQKELKSAIPKRTIDNNLTQKHFSKLGEPHDTIQSDSSHHLSVPFMTL